MGEEAAGSRQQAAGGSFTVCSVRGEREGAKVDPGPNRQNNSKQPETGVVAEGTTRNACASPKMKSVVEGRGYRYRGKRPPYPLERASTIASSSSNSRQQTADSSSSSTIWPVSALVVLVQSSPAFPLNPVPPNLHRRSQRHLPITTYFCFDANAIFSLCQGLSPAHRTTAAPSTLLTESSDRLA